MPAPADDAAVNGPPTAAPLRIRRHPAAAGLTWVQRGLRLFARQPLALVVLVGLGPLILLTVSVIPRLGDLAFPILVPAVSVGMLTVCRSVDRGLPPGIASYLAALRDPVARLRLLQVGIYSALFTGLVALAVSAIDGEQPAASPAGHAPEAGNVAPPALAPPEGLSATPPETAPAAPAPPDAAGPKNAPAAGAAPEKPLPLPVMLALLAVMLPYLMTVWFAPPLTGWYRMSAPKALFFSFFACWRNRAALLVYLVTLMGLGVLALLVVGSLIAVLDARSGLAPYLIVAPVFFLLLAISQCSNLAMVEDIIDDGSEPGAALPDTTARPPG
jgi:hypothetical protein